MHGITDNLFPAHAGMNRVNERGGEIMNPVPRPRGDEPTISDHLAARRHCSPPTRG